MTDTMTSAATELDDLISREYQHGFVTDVAADALPRGLSEDVVRLISAKKNEPPFMLEWRLAAFRHWLTMTEPNWATVRHPPIDYQDIIYYSAPKSQKDGPKSLDDVDPELLRVYEKLGVPLKEREMLAGVAVDAVFDSVSVGTTFKAKLGELGIIFCSFSEAVQEHPDLVKQYLGSVVPYTDNFFAALNSAVFSDGSFCYIPRGVRCPMELSTYFRINAQGHRPVRAHADHRRRRCVRQLSRRLHRADARREPAPRGGRRADRPRPRAHQVFDGAELVSGRQGRQGRHLQLRHQARRLPRRRFAHLLDAGRDGLGHHVEVSRAASCAATIPLASSIRSR